jgi:hypothetical protein
MVVTNDDVLALITENDIYSSVLLNSLVLMNIFKLYLSVLKPMNMTLYSLIRDWNRCIYGSSV